MASITPTFRFHPIGLDVPFQDILGSDKAGYLHPGKSAAIRVNNQTVGVFGELHPMVKEKYEFDALPGPGR